MNRVFGGSQVIMLPASRRHRSRREPEVTKADTKPDVTQIDIKLEVTQTDTNTVATATPSRKRRKVCIIPYYRND
jgi:hypothetical protein